MVIDEIESSSLGDGLLKVTMFVIVQALVYIILSNSSNVFSKSSKLLSSSLDRISVAQLQYFLPDGEDFPKRIIEH
ncbi:unnamed protein product [Rhodiola kirilowii]